MRVLLLSLLGCTDCKPAPAWPLSSTDNLIQPGSRAPTLACADLLESRAGLPARPALSPATHSHSFRPSCDLLACCVHRILPASPHPTPTLTQHPHHLGHPSRHSFRPLSPPPPSSTFPCASRSHSLPWRFLRRSAAPTRRSTRRLRRGRCARRKKSLARFWAQRALTVSVLLASHADVAAFTVPTATRSPTTSLPRTRA